MEKAISRNCIKKTDTSIKEQVNIGKIMTNGSVEDIIVEALMNMKNHKAPGLKGILVELIKHSPVAMKNIC